MKIHRPFRPAWGVWAVVVLACLVLLGALALHSSVRPTLRKSMARLVRMSLSQRGTTSADINACIRRISLDPVLQAVSGRPLPGLLRANPANPRYFSDASGKAVYLTGSHTWSNLQDISVSDPPPAFNFGQWLDFVAAHGHNFFRLWSWEHAKWEVSTGEPFVFAPLPFRRTGPGLALDGKPRFDLKSFDENYFTRLRVRAIEAGRRGMYVAVMLFDGWSVSRVKGDNQAGNPWRGHPFHRSNNINGIDGDPNGDESGEETHELRVPAVTAIQEAYVRKVVDTVGDLDNVLYEISNESHTGARAWEYHMIDFIHAFEATRPKQHPVGMAVFWPGGSNQDLYASPADWISPNGDLNDPEAGDGRKVVIYDTDHTCGICGDYHFAWKSITRGLNPLFMDRYDDGLRVESGGYYVANENDFRLRVNLGYARAYASHMDLSAARPRGELATTGYCLACLGAAGTSYLVYAPNGGGFDVDLSGAAGSLSVEWFNPRTGGSVLGGTATGGGKRSFQPPFSGAAVLYLSSAGPAFPPSEPRPGRGLRRTF
ncbi:MAG: hypothetical protein IT159_15100 [Bryobacterales bacterium]|nr:hypothetical protein [Bryobacterales bacterium]